MKRVIKLSMGLFLASSILLAEATPTIKEEALGLRKTNLYDEDNATKGDGTQYGDAMAGTSQKIERAFQDAPPMIPHSVEGMLPITINNNMCKGCHMPDVAPAVKATPIPDSHFTDFRPKHSYDGKEFKKAVDEMKNEVSLEKKKELIGARFNCSQCHAPQSKGDAPANNFEAQFRTKDGANKSSWNGSSLTEGLDTLAD